MIPAFAESGYPFLWQKFAAYCLLTYACSCIVRQKVLPTVGDLSGQAVPDDVAAHT